MTNLPKLEIAARYPDSSPKPITPTNPIESARGNLKKAKQRIAANPINEIDNGSIIQLPRKLRR